MTAYNGHTIEHDAIENPTYYYNGNAYAMRWEGRKLYHSEVAYGALCEYGYDSDGQRISKKVGNDEYTYLYYGTKLMRYGKTGRYELYFFYDDNDQLLGFYYTDVFTSGLGRKFYFVLNAQGDVVQLRDSQNRTVANYRYDAWGKLLSITDPGGMVNETLSMKEEWERYSDKQKEYYQKICLPNILPALLYPLITHHSDCFYIEIRQ